MQRSPAEPVAGRDCRIGGEVHVRVGEHQHVVLRPTERLHALALAGAALVDGARYGRRTHEAQGCDVRVLDQALHRDSIAVDHVEDTVGQARLSVQLCEQVRRRGIPLGGLQQDTVSAREGDGRHPERHHHRKVEGRDAAHDTERLTHRHQIDTRRDLGRVVALEQLRDAAGELHGFEAALHLTESIGLRLAVLARDDLGKFVSG